MIRISGQCSSLRNSFLCIGVNMCDLVHDVDTESNMLLQLTASGNSF